MYTNILVPVDTTYNHDAWAKQALQTASEISQKSEATVHVLTVVPDNLLKGYYPSVSTETVAEQTKIKLEEIVKKHLPGGTRMKMHIAQGGVCTEILKVARTLPSDLIVMASHGPLTRDYFLGSNAAHVALHAPCSVFVVRDMQEAA